jgi:hypothetical protein
MKLLRRAGGRKLNDTKPWYKSQTLWWIALSTIAASAQPIGAVMDKRDLTFTDFGGLIGVVGSNAMAAKKRLDADSTLSVGKENEDNQS